ncbi:putative vacuolar protein sorting-associated protein Ist1 [Lupinus albus]|uniref:Putative vacuolar protein sorting-associated protein Ist1 n=1 Tax=Lupinus albus TaxID=3870 RepID=A0A6A4NMK8_LUPAL|nr:putative vacuolar protein sorting-associated protein Ist1 [Lupinus albus]
MLTTISEEHNIKWEPKSFGENDGKSSQDLLVGPNNFEKASYVEPSQIHVSLVHDERAPPDLRSSSQTKPMHDTSTNSYEQNASGATRKVDHNQSTMSRMSIPEIRPSGTGSQEKDFRDSNSGNGSSFSMGRKNWNMEFKDATSAAQAAAESAERASVAARAAAELSNRESMTMQYLSGSNSYSGSRFTEVPQEYAFHDDNHLPAGSVENTFHRKGSGMYNEQITAKEQDNPVGAPNENDQTSPENVVKRAQSTPLSSSSSFGDNPFAHGSQTADIYQDINSFVQENSDLHEVNIKKQESRTEIDFMTELHGDGDLNTENSYQIGDATPIRQSIKAPFFHRISPSDEHNHNLNSYGQEMGNKAVEDLFVTDEGTTQINTIEASSYNDTSVAFDDSGSEDGEYKFDFENKYKVEISAFDDSVDPLENTISWRHGQDINEKESSSTSQSHFSVVSERLTTSAVSSEKEDLLPLTFDNSDDAGSDSEVDLVKSTVAGTFDYRNSVLDQSANHETLGSSSRYDKNVGSNRKPWLSPSSVGSDTVEEQFEKKVEINPMSDKTFDYRDLRTSQPLQLPDTFKSTETLEESHAENDKELNYGMLKGGFRNRAYKRPPYIKNTSNESPSAFGDISIQNERSFPTIRTSISSDTPIQDRYTGEVSRGSRSAGLRNISSDSDSYEMVSNSQDTLTRIHDSRIQNEQIEEKKKSNSRASITYFDSDYSESEDELAKKNSANLTRPVSGMSRRTSGPSKTGTGLSSSSAPSYKASVTSGKRLGWNSSRDSYENDNQRASYMMKSSVNRGSSEPGLAEHAASKPISEPNGSPREEIMISSEWVQPSSSLPKTVIEDSEEGKGAAKSEGDTTSKQKPDHIHPKLPDYDSIAAKFMSLKKDHQ